MFKIQRQHLAIQIIALGLANIRTTLHNVLRSQDDSHLCMRVLYDRESVVDMSHMILQRCTTVARPFTN